MPHDSHTTHEPDRVGREGEDASDAAGHAPGMDDDIHHQPTLLMFGGIAARPGELRPAVN